MTIELDDIVKALTKEFGASSAFRMTELPDTGVTGWTSSGSAEINAVIGRAGIPDGRVTTIIGPPSAGKTTLVTHIIAEHQKRGGIPFYFNTECSFEPERAQRIGLDLRNVVVSQPGTCEEAFHMIKVIADSASGEKPILVCWDTFSATPTRSEVYGTGQAGKKREEAGQMDMDSSMGGRSLGEHARLASHEMRVLQGPMERKNVTLLVVLQSKEKIGLTWGSGVTYLAEKTWYFYSNVQLECKKVSTIKQSEVPIGIKVQVFCRKNKLAPPFQKCEVDCMFENGFDDSGNLLEKAIEMNLVQVTGKGRFAYAAGDGTIVKFTKGGKKGLNWKQILETVPYFRQTLEGVKEDG